MTHDDPNTGSAKAAKALRPALKSQYHAALDMLRQTIDQWPQELWNSSGYANPFWHIAYHTLFFTHLYMQPNEAAFRPWEHDREEYWSLGPLPYPPHRAPRIGEPYTKAEILEYWRVCERMVNDAVDTLDLDALDCGFPWYTMPKAEHQIMNIRHIQHHAGQLSDRVRAATGSGVDWTGACPSPKPGNKA